MRRYTLCAALLGLVAACHSQEDTSPVASIGGGGPAHPVVEYRCGQSTLAVQQLGESVLVRVDGAAPITLPQQSSGDTTIYSNGRQSITIQAGRLAWAGGPTAPIECIGG